MPICTRFTSSVEELLAGSLMSPVYLIFLHTLTFLSISCTCRVSPRDQ